MATASTNLPGGINAYPGALFNEGYNAVLALGVAGASAATIQAMVAALAQAQTPAQYLQILQQYTQVST
jgi:hypothetical protein